MKGLPSPGKIAIVYTQHKDAEEYTEYIEFLQNKNLIKPGMKRLMTWKNCRVYQD